MCFGLWIANRTCDKSLLFTPIVPASPEAWQVPGQRGNLGGHCQPARCCWLIFHGSPCSACPRVPHHPLEQPAKDTPTLDIPSAAYLNYVWLRALPAPANKLGVPGYGVEVRNCSSPWLWRCCFPLQGLWLAVVCNGKQRCCVWRLIRVGRWWRRPCEDKDFNSSLHLSKQTCSHKLTCFHGSWINTHRSLQGV